MSVKKMFGKSAFHHRAKCLYLNINEKRLQFLTVDCNVWSTVEIRRTTSHKGKNGRNFKR